MIKILGALVLGGGILCAGVARAATSAVYCHSGKPSMEFAGRIEADGGLLFGLSVWDQFGNNSFAFGKALKQGDHWLYVAKESDYDTSAPPCRLEIWYSERDGVRAKAEPRTDCSNHRTWDDALLSRKSYQGPVTVELDDPSNFFEEPPGLLGKGDCFKQNPE